MLACWLFQNKVEFWMLKATKKTIRMKLIRSFRLCPQRTETLLYSAATEFPDTRAGKLVWDRRPQHGCVWLPGNGSRYVSVSAW